MFRLIRILTLTAVVLAAGSASALAVPRMFQYQGRLTDDAGEPLLEPADVRFTIYDEEEEGTALWTQLFEALPLDNGRFSVLLGGEDAPFTPELDEALAEGADLYLAIQVGEDDEMAPRQQIASVAYALRAAHADTAEFAASTEEIEGMPGIAFHAVHRELVDPGASLSVVSVTLETPADGFVLLTGSGTLVLDNSTHTGVLSHVNVGEELDGIPESTMGLVIASLDAADAAANRYVPFHSQRVYAKPAGEHTFHLNVRNNAGPGQVAVNRPSLTALFVPNVYGDAEIESANQAPPAGGR